MKTLKPFEISLSGINLIEASAGTGKTYNIASLYIRALTEQDIEVKGILVVTYTEAATKELRERLMKRLRQCVQALEGTEFEDDEFLRALPGHVTNNEQAISKLKKAIRSFDEAAIYTIHGFCYQALQEQAFESRAMFDAELIGDDKEVVRQAVDDYWRRWVHEISEDELRQPLLKYLMDKGYDPDSLTDELAGFVGKPYLNIQPENPEVSNIEERLKTLADLFETLKHEWENSREEIFKLLDGGHLSYYRTDWLQGWMVQMHEWIDTDVPPIVRFDKFDKFTQSSINSSLKKSSADKEVAAPKHPFFEAAESYQKVSDSLKDFDISFKLRLFRQLLDTLDIRKEEDQQLSYDDLLIRLRDALVDSERGGRLSAKIKKSYPIALVDEFQDTDPIQYEIFRTIYGKSDDNSSLFMIGDPKQSIYSFRGADIFAYLKAKKDAPEEQTFSLDRNFRSVPELLSAVNAIFSHHENPFILKDIPFHPVSPGKKDHQYKRLQIEGDIAIPIEIRRLDRSSDELPLNKGEAQERCAGDTALQIESLLRKSANGEAKIGDESVKAADIAVLVRSHFQAGLVRSALRDIGIKSVQYSQESVFKSDEAEELQFVLKAIAEPVNEGFVKTALATKIMGYTATDLMRLEEDESTWVEKLEQFSKWHIAWQKEGFASMFRQMMKDESIPEQIINRSNGERKLTNLVHLSELLQQKEKGGKTGTRSLLQWLARKRNEEQKDLEEEQLRLESDENLVKVVTMHRSKGLEYPIVFCPFLWHGPEYSDKGNPIVYHDPEEQSKVYLDFGGKNDPERISKRFLMAQENLAEGVRLAYVAVTRAEQKCVISWIQASKTEYSPLGYLLLGREESFNVLEHTLSPDRKYASLKPEKFEASIRELTGKESELFAITSQVEPKQHNLLLSDKRDSELHARLFQRKSPLREGFSISSFSSLTYNRDEEYEVDYDVFIDEPGRDMEAGPSKTDSSIFTFPKGPKPGTAIHHIFEEIDFADPKNLSDVITNNLGRHDIDLDWKEVVSELVYRTIGKNLLVKGQQFKLSDLKQTDLVPELEFYFRTGKAALQELLQIIRPGQDTPLSATGFSEEGFMKGFIDLTFKHNNKYYILDYKSNYLGDTIADYNRSSLEVEMKKSMYDLQYHLYVLALHRYLNNVKTNEYTYQENFGGAFYLFLRGLNEEGDEGIYFDRPDFEVVKALDTYLQRKETYE